MGLVSGFGVPERVKGEVDNLDGDAAKAAETKGAASGAERMASLIDELAKLSGAEHCEYEPADFEKDDDGRSTPPPSPPPPSRLQLPAACPA